MTTQQEAKPRYKVWDKTERREKFVVMMEWNMDNPKELIEVHTWPNAIYAGGYRAKNTYHKRRIDELEFIQQLPEPTSKEEVCCDKSKESKCFSEICSNCGHHLDNPPIQRVSEVNTSYRESDHSVDKHEMVDAWQLDLSQLLQQLEGMDYMSPKLRQEIELSAVKFVRKGIDNAVKAETARCVEIVKGLKRKQKEKDNEYEGHEVTGYNTALIDIISFIK